MLEKKSVSGYILFLNCTPRELSKRECRCANMGILRHFSSEYIYVSSDCSLEKLLQIRLKVVSYVNGKGAADPRGKERFLRL